MCLIPKRDELDGPGNRDPEEGPKEAHTSYLKKLAISLDLLDTENNETDPLELRILGTIKSLKEHSINLQEERDILKSNSLEVESKLESLLTGIWPISYIRLLSQ